MIAALVGRLRSELQSFRAAVEAAPDPRPGFDLFGLRRPVGKAVHALVHEHGTARELAVAVWLGAVIGATPLYGFHVALCVVLGIALRLNKLAMWLAANISLPIFTPFLAFSCVQAGSRVLDGQWLPLTPQWFTERSAREVFVDFWWLWMVGSIPVGALVGLPMAGITYLLVRRREGGAAPEPDSVFHAARRAIRRAVLPRVRYWQEGPVWAFHWKTLLDPVYRTVLARLPPGASILDVGGGEGYFPLLHEQLSGVAADRLVLDADPRRLREGQLLARHAGLTTRFEEADARTTELPPADVVLAIDLLHYFTEEVQDSLLTRLTQAVRPGGCFVLRDIDADAGARARWTVRQERVALAVGRTRAAGVFARPMRVFEDRLRALGFDVERADGAGDTGSANVILFARRPADRAAGAV